MNLFLLLRVLDFLIFPLMPSFSLGRSSPAEDENRLSDEELRAALESRGCWVMKSIGLGHGEQVGQM